MPANTEISRRLSAVNERIARAAHNAGRAPHDVRLIAVSKFHPADAVALAAAAGQAVFGESYVQEARRKQDELAALPGLEWHFIGHLQRNKVKDIAGRFSCIHSLDSEALAETLQSVLEKRFPDTPQLCQDVCIQVNIGEEAQKSGIPLKFLPSLAEKVLTCNRLRLCGLMAIPPVFDAPEAARPLFAALRQARDRLESALGIALPHLSMGMSGDLEAAIAEGATMVRVGTDIFGERPARPAQTGA